MMMMMMPCYCVQARARFRMTAGFQLQWGSQWMQVNSRRVWPYLNQDELQLHWLGHFHWIIIICTLFCKGPEEAICWFVFAWEISGLLPGARRLTTSQMTPFMFVFISADNCIFDFQDLLPFKVIEMIIFFAHHCPKLTSY